MFDIGVPELALILVIALLVFGPSRMVEIGRELGKAVRDFRRATTDLGKEFNDALRVDEPAKPPVPAQSIQPPPEPPAVAPTQAPSEERTLAAVAAEVAAATPPLTAPACSTNDGQDTPPPAPATPGVPSA